MKSRIKEIIIESTHIEIRGNSFLMLDGIERLLCYEDEKIAIKCRDESICIRGKNLTLDCLSDNKIAVKGCILSLEFVGIQVESEKKR
ncbi:MAG: YabP/YqfC family sporulation protein [Clostridia bacterium]